MTRPNAWQPTKNERRYLSRFECAWCDQPLDRDTCGAIGEKCSESTRRDKRERCLLEYRPRLVPAPSGAAPGEGE